MLPRKKYLRGLCLLLAVGFGASSLVSAPAQAVTRYTPPVTVQEISPKLLMKSSSTYLKTVQVVAPTVVKPFSVVGLTWLGTLPEGTTFKARVRESGKWSSWNELHFSDDHGVDVTSLEATGSRNGTDPFMSAVADAIEVNMTNKSGLAPKDLKVDLIGSQETKQDRALLASVRNVEATVNLSAAAVTPAGGVVLRPNIVTRAQWGADETWRDPVPRMGTKIDAGFVHHTASTNNYSPEQAPAQMRALYAYYTKSLKYADMAYNFLVDQYGTVYEGRNACTYGDVNPCDGPSLPVIGAHTAGLNLNTFAISAIGNYDTKAPSNPAALVESIASLMAWKIAPYGLDPNANASMISSDTSGLSKYSNGMTAITPVISGHRDVGKTACPGRYLYPYLPAIRARATELLLPVIRDVSVSPLNLNQSSAENVNVQATIPATANWAVEVTNEATGQLINSISGVQGDTGAIQYTWNRTDQVGNLVPAGRYAVSIKATLRDIALPAKAKVVTLAAPPTVLSKVSFKRVSPTKTKVAWNVRAADVAPATNYEFRISSDRTRTWTKWSKASRSEFVTAKWRRGQIYYVELKSSSVVGTSNVIRKKYVVSGYAPPKPLAVSAISFIQATPETLNASWTGAISEYESEGFYVRTSINGNKWTAWKKTDGKQAQTSIKVIAGDKVRLQVKEKNFSGFSPIVTGRFTAN